MGIKTCTLALTLDRRPPSLPGHMANLWRAVVLLSLVACTAACETLQARRIASEAASLYGKGEYEDAAKKYEEAIKIDPSIKELHLNLAFSYLQLLRTVSNARQEEVGKKAIHALIEYRKVNPGDPRGRDFLLQTFVDTLLYDEAHAYLKPEIERTPPSIEAINILGQIATKKGDIATAETWCRKRIEVAPQDPAGYQCLGALLWANLHKNPDMPGQDRLRIADQGIEAMMRAIELKPEVPDPYTFANLIHRERALGHPCGQGFDAGLDDRGKPVDAGIDEKACEAAKAADLEAANKYMAMAKERIQVSTPDGGAKTSTAADGGN